MNLEACYIYKDIVENNKMTYKNRDWTKLFSATIPYSLETIRIDEMFPDTFYPLHNKQYTRKIINITFDKNYTKWDANKEWRSGEEIKIGKRITIANKKNIRKYLYKNGFDMDGIHYVFYKRGSAKAKNGYAFFIQKELKDKLIERSRLGLKFEEDEECDLTSLLAYESLISSGIEFTINLNPKTEILLIDDIYGKEFESKASVTKEIDGEIVTKTETITLKNCLTDGQGLLDESVFEQYSKSEHGFMLLRSDMFKCCAFNTKLQKWFEYNNITTLTDMFGNEYDTSKIKLVTTPNSLKFLKFAYKISENNKDCYEYWKNHVDNIFGVVKCDKEGNFGSYNRTTYQLLNSIPNLTKHDLEYITELERNYVMLLKNDNAVFRNYLGCDAKASLRLEKGIDSGDLSLYENTDLMNALLLVNSDVQYTKKFKKMKSDLIANYIGHLREGKIRMKDAKYVTLFSNPFEMLLASICQYKNESIMVGREIYCPYYENQETFCATRNPHVNAGNVMYTTNKYHLEYDDWFNFTDNICAINFYDNDAPDRLQGCDTDSDTFLLIPDAILASKAYFCEKEFPTPINRVKGQHKPRKNNMIELQKLDVILSDNYIGKIINMSQIINSYMNEAIYYKKDQEIIDALFQASSKLSSLSQIEIDKSKKIFDNVNMGQELSKIRNMKYLEFKVEKDRFGKDVRKMVVPNFFEMIAEDKEYRVFRKFVTPLDILQDVLVFNHAEYRKGEKNIGFAELLVPSSSVDGRYSLDSMDAIFKIVEKCGKKINGLKVVTCKLNDKAKQTIKRNVKKEAIDELKKLNPSDATILEVLNECFNNRIDNRFDFSRYGLLTLNLLFIAKKLQVLKCFRNTNIEFDEILVKMKDEYDYDLFGERFQKVNLGDILSELV